MIAEVLIYVPSVANFRRNWLSDRHRRGADRGLVLEASPAERLSADLEASLLAGVGARAIVLEGGGKRRALGARSDSRRPDAGRRPSRRLLAEADPRRVRDAFRPAEGPIRVIGPGMGERRSSSSFSTSARCAPPCWSSRATSCSCR